jgi:multidrug efflux system membrane fusion protein
MSKGKWLFGVAVLALIAGAVFTRDLWTSERAAASSARAQAQRNRPVPVEVAKVVHKQVPVRIDALGTVTPIASVALKSRVDTTITGVHFKDGARVEKGDLLFTLDCRQIEADMKRIQAVIDGAEATLAEAQEDVERYTKLAARNATPIVTLKKARTLVNVSKSTAESNRAQLENLRVQLGFCSIKAPISGRISMAQLKVGNFVRQADSMPMATINQMAPVYVTFSVPQKNLPDLRRALAARTATVAAMIPGEPRPARGEVSMIENTVDSATGMATIRATMPNEDERLWPGTLVTTQLTLRSEPALVVPTDALQVSQAGNFVFVVDKGAAKVRPVEAGRQFAGETVIKKGLAAGETVVTDGQLRLQNGTRVVPRGGKPAHARPPRAGS